MANSVGGIVGEVLDGIAREFKKHPHEHRHAPPKGYEDIGHCGTCGQPLGPRPVTKHPHVPRR